MAIQGKWKLSGGLWTDESGNGNTLTQTGTINQTAGLAGGGANKAADFVPTAYLRRADASCVGLDGAAAITIGGRFKIDTLGTGHTLVNKMWWDVGLDAYSQTYSVQVQADNKLYFHVSVASGGATTFTGSSTVLSAGVTYHFFAIYDGANLQLYINNVADGTPTARTGTLFNSTAPFSIGINGDDAGPLDGKIDDIFFANHAFDATERSTYYNYGDDFVASTPVNISIPSATLNFTGKVPTINVTAYTIIQIPSTAFNFTGKVPTILIVAPIILTIPSATFNFTRFAPIIVIKQDKNILVPTVAFNFTGKVPVFSMTGHKVIQIPSTTFNFSGKVPSILLSNTEEEITWELFENGSPLVGVVATIKIYKRSNGHLLDWSDGTFKLGGGTSPAANMQEIDTNNLQGYYRRIITIGGWGDDWYLAVVSYTTTPSTKNQVGSVEFLIKGGKMVDSYNSTNLDVASSTVNANVLTRLASSSYTAPDNAGIAAIQAEVNTHPTLAEIEASTVLAKQAKLDFVEKWILNKLVESPSGTWKLYDDDGVTALKTWTWDGSAKVRSEAV